MALPTRIRQRLSRTALPVLAAMMALAVAQQAPVDAEARPSCSEAAIEELRLPVVAAVDEVRVDVARTSPAAGAALVRVDVGRFGRRLRVEGTDSRLKFAPALTGKRFQVSLDPVFNASKSACIERITLLRGGTPIATVRL